MGRSGGGGNSSSGKDYTHSWTSESGISKEQLSILQKRQQQYNEYFLPQLLQGLESSSPGSEVFTQQMGNNVQQVNAAFDSSQAATNQIIAQHNLAGGGNGSTAAALKAQNERARASALANAYSSQLQTTNDDKQKFLQLGLGMSPQTTTAAPFHQESDAQGSRTSTGSSNSLGYNVASGVANTIASAAAQKWLGK